MGHRNYLDCARSQFQKGINLVEASAGTGKTYAIAMLVLRSITELGIPVDAILVVTFTKAATEELRSRIRDRLVLARDLVEGSCKEPDETMLAWLETVSDRELVRKRLQLALFDIDRAGIFTIHSFCQRMLTEQALESGQLFDVELLTDIAHINTEVVADFWRVQLYNLSPTPCAVLTNCFSTPDALFASIAHAGSEGDRLVPQVCTIEDGVAAFEMCYNRMAQWWAISAGDLYVFFSKAHAGEKFKKPLSSDFPDWWNAVAAFFSNEGKPLPVNLHFLTACGLGETLNGTKVKKDQQQAYLADWPLPGDLITELIVAAENLLLAFRYALIVTLRDQVEKRLESQGYMSFDDLITRLDKALAEGGEGLRQILGKRFSIGLIDEFQDTDSAQWRIFETLFNSADHYLYLIGDPKQAIYRFRGADIFSYFNARDKAEHQLTLKNNYRSHPDLVHEMNRVFSARANPFAFDDTLMPFYPVEPAKTADNGELILAGDKLPVMNYCQLAAYDKDAKGRWTSGKASKCILNYVIAEACRLLDGDNPATIRKIQDGITVETRLAARDIAVLVRSNHQADLYLQGFASVGIPAIISSKKGVFETTECSELYRLLLALAAPGDSFKLKSAMTISWFNLNGNELQEIWENELEYDGWFNRFLTYYQLWQEKGFLAMMNKLLEHEDVYRQVAGSRMPERRIANIHHLLELVQEAETAEKLGPDQTILWLRSRLAGESGVEDRELRLESDEQAVRIVTMHSAKGLQYPVVFCPYLWYRSSRLKKEKHLLTCHDENKNMVVDIGSEQFDDHRKVALAEELAEDLRLLYVALTRAELRCYTIWVDTKVSGLVDQSFDSALGYLLFPEGGDYVSQQNLLQERTLSKGVEYTCIDANSEYIRVYNPLASPLESLQPLTPASRSLATEYQMTSYSALVSLSEYEDHGSELATGPAEEGMNILHSGMPAGANFGNLVHDSLEKISFHSLAEREDNSAEISKLCKRYGISMQTDEVQDFLATVVQTPLLNVDSGEAGFSLRGLNPQKCIPEMPFYFHVSKMDTARINAILAAEPTVVPLSYKTMSGYLTGFVDLFFEHGGKFYIIDYKTNYLGDKLSDYSRENLVQAMTSHNYGLQFWIYTLVLHKHLQNMLTHYEYETHFGGVMYLFVRGMVPEQPGSGVYSTLPSLDLLARLEKAVGGEE